MYRKRKTSLSKDRSPRKWVYIVVTQISIICIVSVAIINFTGTKGRLRSDDHIQIKEILTAPDDDVEFGDDEIDPEVTCKFPRPDVMNPEVMAFYKKPEPLSCTWFSPTYMAEMDRGTLKLNSSASQASKSLPCQYSEISRPDHDRDVIYGPFNDLTGPVVPESDFVYVECNNIFGLPSYQDFFAYAQRNKSIREYISDQEVSVAMIGLDSMSRMNFMRQMPRSYDYLKNELGAVTMMGFNKVGRNTFPNVMAMLTGRPTPKGPHGRFQSFRFMWDEFSDAGAVTTYAEDWPTVNMFESWGEGLEKKPTHHYMHTFYRAFQNSVMESLSLPKCLGPRPLHLDHFAYLLSVLRVYADSPSFMFTLHNGLTHDDFNTPQLMDDDFRQFLKSAHDEGLLKRTVLVVFGDHGQRVDDVRTTEGGRVEDMMPLVSVVLPENAPPGWERALRRNRHRLLSSYDIYPTLLDVLATLTSANRTVVEELKSSSDGRSMFSEIPRTRTCDDAGILERYCTCENPNMTQMPPSDENCTWVVGEWIDKVNSEMIDTADCARIRFNKILNCKRTALPDSTTSYLITFQTNPGAAVFEASAVLKQSGLSFGEINRINRYSLQSFCIDGETDRIRKMKELCFCL